MVQYVLESVLAVRLGLAVMDGRLSANAKLQQGS